MSKYILQTVLVPTTFSEAEAVAWVLSHGYPVRKIHTTNAYHRFRQHTMDYAKKKGCTSLRTIPIGSKGIKLVIAYCK
jgi:hypothetical protein